MTPDRDDMTAGDEAPEGTESTALAVCPACGGSGRADSGDECRVCGGRGEVNEAVGGG